MIYFLKLENLKNVETINQLKTFLKHKYSIEQDPQLFEEINKLETKMQRKVHLAFLFASPLGTYCLGQNNEKVFTQFGKIDYNKELLLVTNSVRETKTNVKYRKICATQNNFIKVLDEGPLVLHFAGHGEKNTNENFP